MLKIIKRTILIFFVLFLCSCSIFKRDNNYLESDKLVIVNKFKLKVEYKSRKDKSKIRAILKESQNFSSLLFITPLNKVVLKVEFFNSQACVINLEKKIYAFEHIDNLLYNLWGIKVKYMDFISLLKGKKVYIDGVNSIFDSDNKLKSFVFMNKQIYLKINVNMRKKIKTLIKRENLYNYRLVEIEDVFK